MPLEATMIIVDNSDWSRNGDYFPTRWEAQEEAANIIAQAKCEQNAESSVGLMVMAGKQVEILVTPLQDPGRVLASFPNVKIGGKIQLTTALQIAQLALKHRLNKNQKQRIAVFIASPVIESEEVLVRLGQKLRKSNISLDVINLESNHPDQDQKLKRLVEAVNDANDNSHYVQVQPGIQLLSDYLLSTPVLSTGEAGGAGIPNEFGIAGSLDPDLEMALRISLEEEKARKQKEDDEKKAQQQQLIVERKPEEVEAMKVEEPKANVLDVEEMDEEELLKRAQELSLQDTQPQQVQKKPETEVFQDPDFVKELLAEIPGLDPNDPELKRYGNGGGGKGKQQQQAKRKRKAMEDLQKKEGKPDEDKSGKQELNESQMQIEKKNNLIVI